MLKRHTVRKDRERIYFACVVGKNPNTPNLSPMADNAITRGSIPGLGSPMCICAQGASFLQGEYGFQMDQHNIQLKLHTSSVLSG